MNNVNSIDNVNELHGRKATLYELVEEIVNSIGECDISTVTIKVSKYLSTAHIGAMTRYYVNSSMTRKTGRQRKKPIEEIDLERGKRRIVSGTLGHLARKGRIRRVSRGVYAPNLS